jgi:hypothetical protein
MANPAPRATHVRRLEQVLVLGVFAWLTLRTTRIVHAGWAFTTDDAYITMRYARHLAEGHGVVWNVGEQVPVEGYSNFLFVLLGAAALKVGVHPILLVKGLCCAAIAPTCVLLYILARRWLRPLAATLPAVLLTSHRGLVYWAVSGLETTLFQLFVVAAATAFIVGLDAPSDEHAPVGGPRAWSRSRLHLVAAGLCTLACLTRPEAPLLCVVLGLTTLVDTGVRWRFAGRGGAGGERDEPGRALLVTVRAFALAFVLPYGLYFLWRTVHFGRLLPNTVYCKSAFSETGDPWTLIRVFWDEGKVFLLLALVQDPKKLGARALPLFLLPMAYAAALYGADPIVGQFSRHFLAAIALLVVASSIGLANLVALAALPFRWGLRRLRGQAPESRSRPWALLADAALVLACLAFHARGQAWLANETPRDCAHRFDDPKDPWVLSPPFDLAYHASCLSRREDGRAALGRYLDRTLSPQQSYVLGDDGIAPYLSHANVIDAFCLNSAELTRPPISFDQRRFLDSVFARSPDVIVVHSYPGNRLRPRTEYGFYPALVADARFAERYEHRRGDPVIHAESFDYWIYERRP